VSSSPIMEAPERVLSTLNKDGSRRWLRPRLAKGPWLNRRFVLGWFLIVSFLAIPHLRIGGKPVMLFDLPAREFTLFGTTFYATDTLLLMLFMVGILLSIFLLTALLGRVWCGWACPQTVYMEFLYRPIERLFEGDHTSQHKLDQQGGMPFRRLLKFVAFAVVSAILGNTFLAYWVTPETLFTWISSSPADHPGGFAVMFIVSLLTFVDFAWFREQTCIVACPYGRFQSVLLDANSLIVGYDKERGEPRTKLRKEVEGVSRSGGDCIDCNHCVVVCPTGIDIREGLQMECIHCTQCIDACDTIMERIGRPKGLIRYSSQAGLASGTQKFIRPRVLFYPALLILVFGLLGWKLSSRESAEVTILRGLGTPYTLLPGNDVSNAVRIRVQARSEDRSFWIILKEPTESELIVPINPLRVRAGATETASVFVKTPAGNYLNGQLPATFVVTDSLGFYREVPFQLLGPKP
jgi:cytochrome c oxidase accessory protein FixG